MPGTTSSRPGARPPSRPRTERSSSGRPRRAPGCMLYLYGASGTTYLYIHLNNDLTAKRDNRGTCVPGVAYANGPEDRLAGQGRPADRLQRRLGRRRGHLPPPLRGSPERRRRRQSSPLPERGAATALPRAETPAKPVTLGLKGTVVSAGGGIVELSVTSVRVWPGGAWMTIPARSLELDVPIESVVDESLFDLMLVADETNAELAQGDEGRRVHHPDARNARRRLRASPERSPSIGSAPDESTSGSPAARGACTHLRDGGGGAEELDDLARRRTGREDRRTPRRRSARRHRRPGSSRRRRRARRPRRARADRR